MRAERTIILAVGALAAVLMTNLARTDAPIRPADTSLRFDDIKVRADELHFRDQDDLLPADGDFELVDYSLMSNDLGERWALVTVRNTTTGNRLLRETHIVATLADGTRKYPLRVEENFKGNETVSKAIFFGVSSFPIISLEMR